MYFIETVNSLISFIENLNKWKKILTSTEQENLKDIDKADIKIFNGIVNVVSSPNSNINISINNYYNGSNFSLDYEQASLIKKNIPLYTSNSQENLEYKNSEVISNALIYFVQTNIKSEKANIAICEKVSKRPIKTIFDNDEIKKEILENPYNDNFIVDIEVQYRENKPALYTILKLKEKWENENLGL